MQKYTCYFKSLSWELFYYLVPYCHSNMGERATSHYCSGWFLSTTVYSCSFLWQITFLSVHIPLSMLFLLPMPVPTIFEVYLAPLALWESTWPRSGQSWNFSFLAISIGSVTQEGPSSETFGTIRGKTNKQNQTNNNQKNPPTSHRDYICKVNISLELSLAISVP